MGSSFKVGDFSNEANGTLKNAYIQITSPSFGDVWYGGTTQNITWVSGNETGTYAEIELMDKYDNGIVVSTIASSTLNNGTYSWTVPLSLNDSYRIKVSSLDDLSVCSYSGFVSIMG